MTTPPPPSADRCSCAGLRKATRHLTQHYDQHLAPMGLNIGQYSLLANLARHGPIAPGAFAALMAMDRTTMGRNLQPLEREGLVAVAIDPADRRGRLVSLTPEGKARLDTARPLWATAQAAVEARFGAAQAATLRTLLATLIATDLATTP
jgi:DNA-binding MarR family transcriptional regulator